VHAAPLTHVPQKPLLHIMPPPHGVPFVTFIGPSTHTGIPVPHCVTPCLQTFGLPEHAPPDVQAWQPPLPSQTALAPHGTPAVLSAAESTHCDMPLAHEVTPCLHGVGFVEHAMMGQSLQLAFESHTLPGPHGVPTGFAVPSAHVSLPVAQLCMPSLHGPGLPVHEPPATHGLQPPSPSQTSPTAQMLPAALCVESTHSGMPVEQSMTPSSQTFGFVVHEAFAVQEMQAPPSVQTSSRPQASPGWRGEPVSLHTGPLDAQLNAPSWHKVGFVAQSAPSTQGTQAPLVQTWPPSQGVPSRAGSASAHVLPPPSRHAIRPKMHGAEGFELQAARLTHRLPASVAQLARQKPSPQHTSAPSQVPFASHA